MRRACSPSSPSSPVHLTSRRLSRRRRVAAVKTRFPIDTSGTSRTSFPAGKLGGGVQGVEGGIGRFSALKGRLAEGPELVEAFKLSEELGQLAYRVWDFPSLRYDEDQRDNAVNAKRQA